MTIRGASWFYFSLGVLLFGIAQTCEAQGCRVDYTFSYSMYISGSSDGTHIYTSVLTEGSGSGSPSLGCNYPNAHHNISSYNKVGGTGGWVYGNPGYMTGYQSVENDQDIVGAPGVLYDFSSEGLVVCTVFGTLFSSAFDGKVGESVGNFVNGGPGGIYTGGCLFKLSCPAGTSSKCAPPSVSAQGSDCSYPYDHEYYLTWTPTGKPTECFSPNIGFVAESQVNCY